jgi:pyrroline-5-carboxylate reductase
VEKEISKYSTPVKVVHGENLKAVREADVILLGCLPHQLVECLAYPGMLEALEGKLLISLWRGLQYLKLRRLCWDQRRRRILPVELFEQCQTQLPVFDSL